MIARPGFINRLLGTSEPTPKTKVATNKKSSDLFSKRNRNTQLLEKYDIIYRQGGIITQAINTYALLATANGWHVECANDNLRDYVRERLEVMNFDSFSYLGIVDALTFGNCFQEIIPTRKGDPYSVLPRSAKTFDIDYDVYGRVDGYRQITGDGLSNTETTLSKEDIISFSLFSNGGNPYGMSLIGIALDDIMRYVSTSDAITAAIKRHGFRKWHVRVGQSGEAVDKDVLNDIAKEVEDLKTVNEIVTPYDVLISDLDSGMVGDIKEYSHWSLDNLLSSLGVPGELLGIAWGSTEATSKVKLQTFFKRVESIQKRTARAYNTQLIDRMTGDEGAARLVFNDPYPEDDMAKVQRVAEIMKATPMDPYAVFGSVEKVREELGIEVEGD